MRRKSSVSRITLHTLFVLILTGLSLTICLIVFSSFFNSTYEAIVENNSRKDKLIVEELALSVSSDSTLQSIATYLHEKGYIGSVTLFVIQGKVYDYEDQLIPGTYTIRTQMSNTTILDLITTQPEDEVAYLRLTIPEGFTLDQIASRVSDLGIVSKEDFLAAAANKSYPFSFLSDLPKTAAPLEGYLFPDTYFINPNASAEDIIMKMLTRFDEVTSSYSSYLHDSSLTLQDIVTIASIIEEEARVADERPLISGVIYNRLNSDMKLQMCSTVQYALGTRKENLSLSDLAINSPYNTYLNSGLPLAPICSPGSDSLKAAFIPEKHDYYFFVLSNKEKGTHHFSETAEEHAKNKLQYNQESDQNFID